MTSSSAVFLLLLSRNVYGICFPFIPLLGKSGAGDSGIGMAVQVSAIWNSGDEFYDQEIVYL